MLDISGLHWLPRDEHIREKLAALSSSGTWQDAVRIAGTRLDFVQTNALDGIVARRFDAGAESGAPALKLAVLSSSTSTHLLAAIRIGALRRGIGLATYESAYGQYYQELLDPASALHAFAPDFVLFAFDARHLTKGLRAAMTRPEADEALAEVEAQIRTCWRLARDTLHASVLQQTVLNALPAEMGQNEHRLPGSRRRGVDRLNARLREIAPEDGVDLVALDDRAALDGLRTWHDSALWHRTKQDVAPPAAPLYGDLVARVVAARRGQSRKCLVLDLDNTLWGGVIGDDGLDGIVLGQGSALGEGFRSVQEYARDLALRGVILAVSSKNDEANALEAFDRHPEMALRRGDIACFRANWDDKPGNIRAIARELNIGLDALVFLDDNPFERELVREALPMVAVPEVPDDPALVPQTLADAGYFEAVAITGDDLARGLAYQGNRERRLLETGAADLGAYLRGLEMRLLWRPFDSAGLTRIVQLINKTNQFNLTTRRMSESEVVAVMNDGASFGVQFRLLDRFGDNGMIAVAIGRRRGDDAVLHTWLLSCRVLGRQVEQAMLPVIAAEARRLGALRLIGDYIPTPKNGMVAGHYEKLGFTVLERRPDGGYSAALDVIAFRPADTFIRIERDENGHDGR